jgi:hypothetical protein
MFPRNNVHPHVAGFEAYALEVIVDELVRYQRLVVAFKLAQEFCQFPAERKSTYNDERPVSLLPCHPSLCQRNGCVPVTALSLGRHLRITPLDLTLSSCRRLRLL